VRDWSSDVCSSDLFAFVRLIGTPHIISLLCYEARRKILPPEFLFLSVHFDFLICLRDYSFVQPSIRGLFSHSRLIRLPKGPVASFCTPLRRQGELRDQFPFKE
jgi:hypothetical protein